MQFALPWVVVLLVVGSSKLVIERIAPRTVKDGVSFLLLLFVVSFIACTLLGVGSGRDSLMLTLLMCAGGLVFYFFLLAFEKVSWNVGWYGPNMLPVILIFCPYVLVRYLIVLLEKAFRITSVSKLGVSLLLATLVLIVSTYLISSIAGRLGTSAHV